MSAVETWMAGNAEPEKIFNEAMQLALAGVLLYAFKPAARVPGTTTFGIGGGQFGTVTVADTTLTGTDGTENYVVAHRTTGAISSSTATTNWLDTGVYGRIGRASFAATVLTWQDWRTSPGGIFAGGAGSNGGVHALTDAATIAVDASAADNMRVVLGGNRTLGNPTNLSNGQVLNFRIKQDGTGSRTLAYASKYTFPGGVDPVLSTAPNALDFMSCQYDAAEDTLVCVMSKAFA